MNCYKCGKETAGIYRYCDDCYDRHINAIPIDYHHLVNKDTPVEMRRKVGVGDVWINEANCKLCNDTVRSRNKHDYRKCKCGSMAVDGGSRYIKRTYEKNQNDYVNNIVMFDDLDINTDEEGQE